MARGDDIPKWSKDPAKDIANSLKFYTSPIDPKTRKGGGYSRKEAIKMTKKEFISIVLDIQRLMDLNITHLKSIPSTLYLLCECH